MKSMNKCSVVLMLAAISLAVGCKSNRLVFVTQSSIGMDVSGTAQLPNRVSFSFDRYEAAIVPRKTNGEAHSVFGGMDADMTWFSGHAIKQTFATGEAAKLATGGERKDAPATSVKDTASLIFLTATTYGLNLSAGEQSMPPNLLLGYRRTEAAVIPVPDPAQKVRSVYADIHINTAGKSSAVTTNFSTLGGVRIKQSFGTGTAAESLARTSAVREKLADAASLDPKVVEELKSKEAKRARVLKKISKDGTTVDADLLKKLLTGEDGKLLRGTESWVDDYGGKPVHEFEKELLFEGDRHLDTLYERAKKSD
jgi:hypothetical protein